MLEDWPHGRHRARLVQLGWRGPSPLFDLAGCETRVYAIEIQPAPAT